MSNRRGEILSFGITVTNALQIRYSQFSLDRFPNQFVFIVWRFCVWHIVSISRISISISDHIHISSREKIKLVAGDYNDYRVICVGNHSTQYIHSVAIWDSRLQAAISTTFKLERSQSESDVMMTMTCNLGHLFSFFSSHLNSNRNATLRESLTLLSRIYVHKRRSHKAKQAIQPSSQAKKNDSSQPEFFATSSIYVDF